MTQETTQTTPRTAPRFIIHVGPGLAKCRSEADPLLQRSEYQSDIRGALGQLFRESTEQTGIHSLPWAPGSKLLIAPEMLCTSKQATLDVMRAYAEVRAKPDAVLGLMTYSQDLLQTLLSALFTADVHSEVAICLHYEDQAPTVHRMDVEGFLEEWPYGILDANLDEDTLLELGFDVPHRR